MDLNQSIEQSWEANADAWTTAVRKGAIPSRVAGANDAILNAIRGPLPCRVLDVGCGEGWLAHRLACAGYDVTGFDGSPRLVTRAQESGTARFLQLTYAAFVEDPERIEGLFDRVVCNYSLFEEDLGPLLKALHSKLSRSGQLVIQTLHPFRFVAEGERYESQWHVETFQSMGEQFSSSMPFFFRTFASWCSKLRSAGFTLNQCIEPDPSHEGRPLSLILTAERELPRRLEGPGKLYQVEG